jgi:hypothetical protein
MEIKALSFDPDGEAFSSPGIGNWSGEAKELPMFRR